MCVIFFFQAEDGIRDVAVTGVQTCALPISRGGARTHRPGTPRREPDAWAAGWHAWCGVRQWRRAPALSPGSGQLAPSKRDFAGYAGVRIHCTSFAALWFVVRTNSRVEILRVTGFVGSRERGAFDEYEPGAPPRAKRSGGRPGGDGVRAARERRFNDSHVPGIAPSRTGIHGREAPSGTASLHSGFPRSEEHTSELQSRLH